MTGGVSEGGWSNVSVSVFRGAIFDSAVFLVQTILILCTVLTKKTVVHRSHKDHSQSISADSTSTNV